MNKRKLLAGMSRTWISLTLLSCIFVPTAYASNVDDKKILSIEDILRQHPDPFTNLNIEVILQQYGENGSGVGLVKQSVPLQLSKQALVSNVSTVKGATGIVRADDGFGFTIGLSGDYLFEFDRYDLSAKSQSALHNIYTLYRDYEGKSIEIVGHTDSKGDEEYNQQLSERRAETVLQWFLQKGLETERITSRGEGENRPVAENLINGEDNPKGRALNRRVDIKITTNKKVNSLPLISSR